MIWAARKQITAQEAGARKHSQKLMFFWTLPEISRSPAAHIYIYIYIYTYIYLYIYVYIDTQLMTRHRLIRGRERALFSSLPLSSPLPLLRIRVLFGGMAGLRWRGIDTHGWGLGWKGVGRRRYPSQNQFWAYFGCNLNHAPMRRCVRL